MELAIQKDCAQIIEGFVLNENPRFESFVYQWKDSMFQPIYTAQTSALEIIQSTNACIHYAKRILCSKNTMPRLGALFLLYAINFKQPTDRFHKIDVDLTAWLKIKEFLFCLDNMLYAESAKCIFWDLLKEGSFRFVASDIYRGLENLVNLDEIRNLSSTMYVFQSDVKSLTSRSSVIEGIAKLHDGYNEMKELMNKSSSEGNSNCVVPISKSFDELNSALNKLRSFMKSQCSLGGRIGKKAKKNRTKKKAISKRKKAGIGRRMTLR